MNSSFGPFLVICLGLLLGFLYRRSGRFSAEAPRVLNAFLIGIALPAVVLSQIPKFLRETFLRSEKMDGALLFLPLIPWILFLGSIPFFWLLYRAKWIRRDQWGLLVLAGGLGNTSFVGIPLIEALLGADKIPLAILLDQFGSFLALSVGGTLWISYFHSTGGLSAKFSWRKFLDELFRFPPFVALIAAFFIALLSETPAAIQTALERIGATLVPVAMVSVGSQLKIDFKMLRHEWRGLACGIGYKMALAPLVIWILGVWVFGLSGDAIHVGVLEAGMAPMITATILGMDAGFAPNLGALILGIGIPLSLATVPLIHLLLS